MGKPGSKFVTMAIAAIAVCSGARLSEAQNAGAPKCVPGDVDICTRECNGGRAESCAVLGYTFVDGFRVARDPAKGAHFRKQACDGNEFNACGNLAWQYINGVGVPKDFATARVYAEKACRGGDAVACASLRFLLQQPQNQASPTPGSAAPAAAAPPASSTRQALQQPDPSAKPSDEVSRSGPSDPVADAAIDDGFKQWSSSWRFDRYVPGSARATDRGFQGGTYVVRGAFAFMRGASRLTIPFAAAFTSGGDGYRLSTLCYNDVTTGMKDCVDPSDR